MHTLEKGDDYRGTSVNEFRVFLRALFSRPYDGPYVNASFLKLKDSTRLGVFSSNTPMKQNQLAFLAGLALMATYLRLQLTPDEYELTYQYIWKVVYPGTPVPLHEDEDEEVTTTSEYRGFMDFVNGAMGVAGALGALGTTSALEATGGVAATQAGTSMLGTVAATQAGNSMLGTVASAAGSLLTTLGAYPVTIAIGGVGLVGYMLLRRGSEMDDKYVGQSVQQLIASFRPSVYQDAFVNHKGTKDEVSTLLSWRWFADPTWLDQLLDVLRQETQIDMGIPVMVTFAPIVEDDR